MTKFKGTEQELQKLMREALSEYISDQDKYALKIENTQDKQLQTNILEALAKCIDLGYLENLKYIRSIDGDLTLVHAVSDLQNSKDSIVDSNPVRLTKAGQNFLNNY